MRMSSTFYGIDICSLLLFICIVICLLTSFKPENKVKNDDDDYKILLQTFYILLVLLLLSTATTTTTCDDSNISIFAFCKHIYMGDMASHQDR